MEDPATRSDRLRSVSLARPALLVLVQALSVAGYFFAASRRASVADPLAIAILCLPLLPGLFVAGLAGMKALALFFAVATILTSLGFAHGVMPLYVLLLPSVLFVLATVLLEIPGTQRPVRTEPLRYLRYPTVALLTALLLSSFVAWTRGLVNVGLVTGVLTFGLGVAVVWSLAACLKSENQIGRVIHAVVVTAVVSGVIWLPAAIGAVGKRMYLPGDLGRSGMNELGASLGMLVVLTVGLIIHEERIPRRAALGVSLLVLSIGLVLSQSRGAWVGALAGLTYIFLRVKRIRALLIPLALTLLAASFMPLLRERFMLRLAQTEAADPAWLGRVLMWETVVQIISRNLLLGVGLHNFGLVKSEYGFPPLLDPVRPSFAYSISSVLFGHTHNLYLELLMGIGVFGFAAFMIILIMTIVKLDRTASSSPRTGLSGPALGLAALLIAYLVHSLFDYTLWIVRTLVAFAMFLGMSLAVLRQSAKK